jgi:hypothetical protein
MKDRVDKSMGRVTLIVEVLTDIKPTEPLRFAKRGARKKRNCSDSSGNSPTKILREVKCFSPTHTECVCLFVTGLKKVKTEGKQCHAKTMKRKRSWENS